MTTLPEQKQSIDELNELRMRNAFAVRPPVQEIRSLALHPAMLVALYILCFTGVGLAVGGIYRASLICGGCSLLITLLIYWRKPRTRHHASIIVIISLLVLVFGTVYHHKHLEAPDYDPQGPIGY
tara:strand:+ start:662 stop:1036 length:375 start_codon:yes stop_codon:yes gene_type:complete